jgi:hypothetical protein
MASRKQQKEEARALRLAEEQARQMRERRDRRLRMTGGTVLVVAALIAVGIAIAAGGGKSGTGTPITPATNGVKLPPLKISNLAAAAKAAGCVTIDTPDSIARTPNNRQHVAAGTKVNYATNPPSYGPHYPAPASDGEYKPGNTPAISYLVHALEHGRVEYEYRPGLPQADVKDLEALLNEGDGQWAAGQLLVMFQNPTGMPYDVAAVAWGHVLGCAHFNSKVFDAFRDFRIAHSYQGPEFLGTGPE